MTDFAAEPTPGPDGKLHYSHSAYRFVSREWKEAIESLEPGVHEFFPHTADFSDYWMRDHFIFRDRNPFDFVDHERCDLEKFKSRVGMRTPLPGLAAKRELLEGCHWTRQTRFSWAFVSRELALKLLPLLPETLEAPDALRFVPVKLV